MPKYKIGEKVYNVEESSVEAFLEKAKEFISKAILYDDTSAVILEHYGDILMDLNEESEALIFYQKALLLDENNEDLISKISSNENQ